MLNPGETCESGEKEVTEKLYLCVTADEFELPLFASDSLKEMADFLGVKKCSICSAIRRNGNVKIGKGRGKVIKITI